MESGANTLEKKGKEGDNTDVWGQPVGDWCHGPARQPGERGTCAGSNDQTGPSCYWAARVREKNQGLTGPRRGGRGGAGWATGKEERGRV